MISSRLSDVRKHLQLPPPARWDNNQAHEVPPSPFLPSAKPSTAQAVCIVSHAPPSVSCDERTCGGSAEKPLNKPCCLLETGVHRSEATQPHQQGPNPTAVCWRTGQTHSPASERGDNERACPATGANEEEFCVTLAFPEARGTLASVLWGLMGKGESNFWGKGG